MYGVKTRPCFIKLVFGEENGHLWGKECKLQNKGEIELKYYVFVYIFAEMGHRGLCYSP